VTNPGSPVSCATVQRTTTTPAAVNARWFEPAVVRGAELPRHPDFVPPSVRDTDRPSLPVANRGVAGRRRQGDLPQQPSGQPVDRCVTTTSRDDAAHHGPLKYHVGCRRRACSQLCHRAQATVERQMEQPVKLSGIGLPAGRVERRPCRRSERSPSRETDSGRQGSSP
jgi:hypothetical protein